MEKEVASHNGLQSGSLPDTAMPVCMREQYILHHYRPLYKPYTFYLKSIFSLHNETCNIWSHLVPLILVFFRAVYVAVEYDVMNDVTLWPVISAYVGVVSCLLLSVVTHTFKSRSVADRHWFYQLDYMGIAVNIQACGTAMHFLVSTPDYYEVLGTWPLYVGWCAAVVFIIGTSITTLLTIPESIKKMLFSFFASNAMMLNILPLLFRLYSFWDTDEDDFLLKGHSAAQVLAIVAALIYVSHFPEICRPGKFDIFGHSHTIFHIVVFSSQFTAVESGLREFISKDLELRMMGQPSLFTSTGGFLLVGISGLLTLHLAVKYGKTQYDSFKTKT